MDDFEYYMTEFKCLKAVLSIYILFYLQKTMSSQRSEEEVF